MYQRVLEVYNRLLGPDHISTLDTVHCIGSLYRKQGKLHEAEAMYQGALQGTEKALGPEHTSTLDTVHALDSLYQEQGKLQEAEAMYQRSLGGRKTALEPNHPTTLATARALDRFYFMEGVPRNLSLTNLDIGAVSQRLTSKPVVSAKCIMASVRKDNKE
jgi:tetratricopeptide (TPR) repeat protein